ncbi:MAG: hypothetical protein JWR38_5449 [Mucilaginibacter sp.]|nr:hypothetical protein [Mucilaginibacter sp.]
MRDNELDNLFQSVLDDHEMEPSAGVWQGITTQLDADKRKRSLAYFLRIAASIVLLVTAGILFIPRAVKVNHQQPSINKIAKNVLPVKPSPIITVKPVLPAADQQNKKSVKAVIAPISNLAAVKVIKANKKEISHKVLPVEGTLKTEEEPELALAARGDDLINPAAPDTENGINPTVDKVFENNTKLVAVQLPAVSKPKLAPIKKRRIRSLGDILNVVIAAVDKREDKFIEFSNTDEDDATITGINLGIIKVKKEK